MLWGCSRSPKAHGIYFLWLGHIQELQSRGLIWHFDLKKFRPNEVQRVMISLACVFAFMAIGWPLIVFKAGDGMARVLVNAMVGLSLLGYRSCVMISTSTSLTVRIPSDNLLESARSSSISPRELGKRAGKKKGTEIRGTLDARDNYKMLSNSHYGYQQTYWYFCHLLYHQQYMNEAKWNWRLLKTILTLCQDKNYVGFRL